MIQMNSKIVVLAIGLLCGNTGMKAQGEASLPQVEEKGFYAIDLPWQVMGEARPDLSDVRLVDGAGEEVPYLLKEDRTQPAGSVFEDYPIGIRTEGRFTKVTVETDGRPLSSFTLRIKNADVKKRAVLQGSNDRKNWYAVKEHCPLEYPYDRTQTKADIKIDFPLSDYRWYLLSVNDSVSAPLNILQVGRWKAGSGSEQNEWLVPASETRLTNGEHTTDIVLAYPSRYYFSKAIFYISSPEYYNREASLRAVDPVGIPRKKRLPGSRRRYDVKMQEVSRFKGLLSPEGNGTAMLDLNCYTDTLKLSIANGDDRPLQIDSVRTYIDRYYLVASLEPGTTYKLTYGNPDLAAPAYDLTFARYVPDTLRHLSVGNIRRLSVGEAEGDSAWMLFFKTYGVWIIIGVIIIQLLYMVRKAMK